LSDADYAQRPEDAQPRRLTRFGGSRLGGFILALNLLSLLILFGGALLLNELRQGLVEARQEALTSQAELLVRVLGEPRVGGRKPRLVTIPGRVPELSDMPPGCPFADRCGWVVDACRAAPPPPAPLGAGHAARCIRLDAVRSAA